MAFSQADLDALDAKILAQGGMRAITKADRSVTFSELDDLLKLRAEMAAQLAAAAGQTRTRLAAHDKGV